jgi:hypothetical protein
VNLAKEDTNASLSVFILKYPQILIERINPSMQRLEIVSSTASSKIMLSVAKLALHVFSNIGLIGAASSTLIY